MTINPIQDLKIDKRTMSEMPYWLNVLMLDTKFPKFLTFQPPAKNDFGKNLIIP